jgi:hypothetical protein
MDDREVMKVDMGSEGTRMVTASFPSNSHAKRQPVACEPKKVERIVKGKVMKQKKTLGKKFMETFIKDDLSNVASYILHDVLIPAARDTLTELFHGSIDMLLGGMNKPYAPRGRGNNQRTNYSKVSYREDVGTRRDYTNRNRANHSFEDIKLESRGEATNVLNHLVDLIDDYGEATIADLYGMVGIREEHTDRKYGWTNLSTARVCPVRGGFLLDLPRPMLLD